MIVYLFLMFWFHILDDFVLQGVMAKMKQKKWWADNAPNPLYKHDYFMALFCHAFMWSISIMIPTIISGNFVWWMIPINCAIHFVIDDLKANRGRLNLIQDQIAHFIQIMITFIVCYNLFWDGIVSVL